MPSALNPAGAFQAGPSSKDVTMVAGLGLFFAFWSWVGFETTAAYGEESKNPKKIVPRATMIAVIGLGIFYTFVSWMAVAYSGKTGAISITQGSSPFSLFYNPVQAKLGTFWVDLYKVMTCTGSFACALAFHNTASRYLYALGREGFSKGLSNTLGASHKKHGSPHIASIVQTVITLAITLLFFWLQKPTASAPDVAYTQLYGLMALLGTMALLIIQSITSIAVIGYFHVRKMHPETASWWRTLLLPLIGAAGMVYVVILLFQNLDFAAGAASSSPVFKATPWIVLGVFLLGLVTSLVIRFSSPEKYAQIGRIVLEESHERSYDDVPGSAPAGAIPTQATGEEPATAT
jgi:amino acid transporter